MLGMHVRYACPPGYDADDVELERLAVLGAASVEQSMFPAEAVDHADAVHTDTWVSMGQEPDKQERYVAFESYTVDEQLMSSAAPGAPAPSSSFTPEPQATPPGDASPQQP